MTPGNWRRNYSQAEVRMLVEGYRELRERKDTFKFGLTLLVLLADLDRALTYLPLGERQLVLLHGLLGIPDAERYFGIDRRTVWRRYVMAIASLTNHLNGG